MWVIFYIIGVYALARMNKKWAVVFATHPLIIIDGLVNTHNDLIMVVLAIAGINWRNRILLLISAGIKYFTLPLIFINQNNKNINRILFIGFLILMTYLSLTREIQAWYFLSFFAWLPYFGEEIMRFNFFSFAMLIGNYLFVRYGVIDEAWQTGIKNSLLFIFFTLNICYIYWKKYLPRWSLFVTLLIVAIISRFFNLWQTAFFVNDQGRDAMVIYEMLFNRKWTLIGPATSFAADFGNIYFGAYYYYLLLPFIAVSRNAYWLTAVVPILFIAGLLIFIKIKEMDFWEKIFFLILVTASWYSLYYTRFLWNLNLAFILSFILFGAFLIFKEKIRQLPVLVFIFGFIAGAVFQIHYGMLFLYLSYPVFFRNNKRNIIFYTTGFLISFFPFVLFDWRHGGVIAKNLVSLLTFRQSAVDLSAFPLIFVKIFDYYLLPFINAAVLVKIIIALAIYSGIIIVLIRRKSELSRFLLLCFLIFPLTFFVFKRNFDYYLACFVIWFYLGMSIALKSIFSRKGIVQTGIILLVLLFFIMNMMKYFTGGRNAFAVGIQKMLAKEIYEYNEKWYMDEAKKNSPAEKSKIVQINVTPNKDDIRGVEYILKTEYGMTVSPQGRLKYIICYPGSCPKNKRGLILLDDNWGLVSTYSYD